MSLLIELIDLLKSEFCSVLFPESSVPIHSQGDRVFESKAGLSAEFCLGLSDF